MQAPAAAKQEPMEEKEEEEELVTPPTRKGLKPAAKKLKTGATTAKKKPAASASAAAGATPKATPVKKKGKGGKGKPVIKVVEEEDDAFSEGEEEEDEDDDDDGESVTSRSSKGSKGSSVASSMTKKRPRPASASSSSAAASKSKGKAKAGGGGASTAKKKKAPAGKSPKPKAKPKGKGKKAAAGDAMEVDGEEEEGGDLEAAEEEGEYLTDIALDKSYFLYGPGASVATADDEATALTLLDGDGERELDDEEGPPPGLPSLPLTHNKLWRERILGLLNPFELASLARVSRHYRYLHISNEVWFDWVLPIQEGSLLSRIRECRILEHTQKTLINVYMAATTHHCHVCTAWTSDINLLTLLPVCWACHTKWCRTGAIVKSKAHEQYLLTPSEGDHLPSITTPDNVTLFLRKHVQDFKAAQYEDGYDGLLAVKAEKVQKAHERYQKALTEFAKKRDAAAKEGSNPPKPPKKPPILNGAHDIIVSDGGKFNDDKHRRYLLAQVGFRRKIHPLIPLYPGDLKHAWQYIMCRYCLDADPDTPDWKRPHFPSYAELYTQHHLRGCEYAKVEGALL